MKVKPKYINDILQDRSHICKPPFPIFFKSKKKKTIANIFFNDKQIFTSSIKFPSINFNNNNNDS